MATSMRQRQIISSNIEFYLSRIDKSRQEIADELGVKYSTFTDWINGNSYPRIDRIEQLAEYFGCNISDLVEQPGSNVQRPLLSLHEREVLDAYRKADPALRKGIDRMLSVDKKEPKTSMSKMA